MTAEIIDGKGFADGLTARVATQVAALKARDGITPGLAVVLVGADPASQVYVRIKSKQATGAGMVTHDHKLPATASKADVLTLVDRLNRDEKVDGILVQFPLPAQIDMREVIERIDPGKDVDGFHPMNAGLLRTGGTGLVPCTPLGCLMLLRHFHKDLAGAEAVVLGRSTIVGRPMAALLLGADCTVTIAHSKTRDLPAVIRRADIVVAAVGRPEMVRGAWIKPGATVIDVGINRVPATEPGKTKLVGDVCFAEAVETAGRITPVPGGVGPMTVACLLQNTLSAACRRRGLTVPGAS
ncbi:MAG: bifunctional methylenetetrahydrofolate dehydrogenase/methenyltetrahydrofolate cyclohydrolase FolD [Alphaproteobacteria bacterium]|nr:bifunctional methylenetetrahydrofolate dehydrogenase/methenyltetrahydrofolate cyclohydrolase FolD [Alphaproteobacteria bacterium]